MGLGKSKMASESTVSVQPRNASIIAHIWPSDIPTRKDLRIHFPSKHSVEKEAELIFKILKIYGRDTEENPKTGNIRSYVENSTMPLLTKKLSDLGIPIKWLIMKV